MKRKVTKRTDVNNYKPGMAAVMYAGKNIPIKKQKVVETARKTKTIDYSPVDYYGKQTKTKTIVKKPSNGLSDIRLNKSGTIGTEPIAKLDKKGNMRNYTEVKLGKLGSFSIKGKKIK